MIRNINGCSFEECMKKIKSDIVIVYWKKSFIFLLLIGLWDIFFFDFYLEKVVEEFLRKKGMGEIYLYEYMNSELVLGVMNFESD